MRKHCLAIASLAVWKIPSHKNNLNYDSYVFSYNFAFIPFLSFLRNQKQESKFQQVCNLITRNISGFLFIASRALFYVDFNIILYGNFLTCYSCSHYSSMVLDKVQHFRLINYSNLAIVHFLKRFVVETGISITFFWT